MVDSIVMINKKQHLLSNPHANIAINKQNSS